jgi:hypothetical protein
MEDRAILHASAEQPEGLLRQAVRAAQGLREGRNEAGELADQAAAVLANKKIGKETEAYKAYSVGKLPPAHIDARARRWTVKLYLAHYHAVAYFDHYRVEAPRPYVLTVLGHADEIRCPNWPF